MASQRGLRKQAEAKLEEAIAKNWGLATCLEHHKCQVCAEYGRDVFHLRQLRNLYISGYPIKVIARTLDPETATEAEELHDHAYRQGWHRWRSKLRSFDISHDNLLYMMYARAEQARPVVNGNSHDKMLELMMKMKGYGEQRVQVEGNIELTWEKIVTKSKDLDGTITLPDEAFDEVDIPDPPETLEIEDHSAPAD